MYRVLKNFRALVHALHGTVLVPTPKSQNQKRLRKETREQKSQEGWINRNQADGSLVCICKILEVVTGRPSALGWSKHFGRRSTTFL